MRLALVTLAALRCRAAAPQSRWRPYLDAGTPIKPSQCVLRFVNVPASAVDANAPPSADVYAKWRGDGEVVIVTGRTYPLLQVAVNAGLAFPRGKLKAPYHQDTMADCCLLELEDPDWLDPQHPMYDFMLEQGGRRGRRPVRACDTRVTFRLLGATDAWLAAAPRDKVDVADVPPARRRGSIPRGGQGVAFHAGSFCSCVSINRSIVVN